jgi:hypothetical protein
MGWDEKMIIQKCPLWDLLKNPIGSEKHNQSNALYLNWILQSKSATSFKRKCPSLKNTEANSTKQSKSSAPLERVHSPSTNFKVSLQLTNPPLLLESVLKQSNWKIPKNTEEHTVNSSLKFLQNPTSILVVLSSMMKPFTKRILTVSLSSRQCKTMVLSLVSNWILDSLEFQDHPSIKSHKVLMTFTSV